jgi:5''-nucleotidase/2'',3''-cyclic phosphodiesterase and related esterases
MNRRKFIYNSSLASLSVMGLNSCNLNSRNLKITILHTNDVHSQIEPFPSDHNQYPNKGGFARRASLFKEIRDLNPNTLIFDAGDIFQGTPYFNFFQGDLELGLMKKMGYNAATMGNHEFDAGLKTLKQNIINNNFQFISSNYDFTNTELEGLVDEYKIYKKEGVKIGVFGLGIELKGLVNPLLFKETKYNDPLDVAKDMTYKLKFEKGCDLIICISHLGHQYQIDKISDTKLAKLTSNIDLIIGGHTHTLLKEPLILNNSLGKESYN